MDECAYVDGVVFRKTVSHKKMIVPEISHHDENCNSNQVHRQCKKTCFVQMTENYCLLLLFFLFFLGRVYRPKNYFLQTDMMSKLGVSHR